MTIQEIKELDFYTCSLKDINKAYHFLNNYVQKLINKGHCGAKYNYGSEEYKEVRKTLQSVARARHGMNPEGYMMGYNTTRDRVPNSQSVL